MGTGELGAYIFFVAFAGLLATGLEHWYGLYTQRKEFNK
jgi:hypothetical protein